MWMVELIFKINKRDFTLPLKQRNGLQKWADKCTIGG